MMAGPALAMLEHVAAARWLGFAPRMAMLGSLARIEAWLVGFFLAFQLGDLFVRGAGDAMLAWSWFAVAFWAEIGLGLLLPLVLLMMPEVRQRPAGLATAAALIIGGVLLHRLNVAVIGLRVRHWETYVPALAEVGITLGITAGAVFIYGVLIRLLPIHEELEEPTPHARPAAAPAGAVGGARPATSH
jgi:formate dehydrogenase iron-sulfur subunit